RNYQMVAPYGHSITKQLADSYLCSDGESISNSPLFMGYENLEKEKQNRDPRFYQTIATPSEIWLIEKGGKIRYWDEVYSDLNSSARNNSPSGYINQKGYNPIEEYHVSQYEETPSILYRYAEVLLNFAEAKAELGQITQTDIDISIKKLRDR